MKRKDNFNLSEIFDSILQINDESSYFLTIENGKIDEFKNYEDSSAYNYIAKVTLSEKTLTLESTISDEHKRFGMLIGCTEQFKSFIYQGIKKLLVNHK